MMTTEQELLAEQILELVNAKDDLTYSDLQGVVMAIASQYQLIEKG